MLAFNIHTAFLFAVQHADAVLQFFYYITLHLVVVNDHITQLTLYTFFFYLMVYIR